MKDRLLTYALLLSIGLLAVGCGGGGGSTSSNTPSPAFVNPTGKILPFTAVAATKPGTTFYIILDRPGGKISSPVKLSGTNDDATGRTIIFTIANQPVGSGDSGSLVIDAKGNSVGALASGFGATSNVFTATAIEDEESILLSNSSVIKGASNTASVQSDGLVHAVRGISPYLWAILGKDKRSPLTKLFTLDTSAPPKSVSKADVAKGTLYSSTIFMLSSYGDAVSAYTYGTITTPDQGKYLCYGHPLNWEGGNQDIPCCFGSVTNFIVDPTDGGSKLAFPNLSEKAGTLIDDRRFGVVVDPTVTATPIPVTGTVTVNVNPAVTFHGFVAKDALLEATLAIANVSQGTSDIVDANEIAGSATGSATVDFADGTTQTVDLTDSNSLTLIEDLYLNISSVMYDPNTGEPLRLKDISFTFAIVTS